MEELVEGLGRGILNVIKWIVIDLFIEIFVHGYGYITLKVFTFGKYPKAGEDNYTLCIISGLLSIAATIAVIIVINSN
jgi:hypothetical protein